MNSLKRALLLAWILSLVAGLPRASIARAEGTGAGGGWTEEDTQLANQYVRLLEVRPEYSKVLDLLWDHYATHGATPLLIEHYKGAAEAADAAPEPRLVYAHLLRKNGDLEQARARYKELAGEATVRPFVLLALAELAIELSSDPATSERHLDELAKEESVSAEILRGALASLANDYLDHSNGEAALRVWRKILDLFPDDLALLEELAARMISAGYLEEAVGVYESRREISDVEKRIAVLRELGRLYELANDFDAAAAALNDGRAATHFKHHTHLAFLSMLVRLYEREGRLEELEDEFVDEASGARPSEKALFTLVRFYDLTASSNNREKQLRELVKAAPNRPEYRQELVEALLSNDRYGEAKRVLEDLLASGVEESLELRLLRVQVELNLEGRESGAALLSDFVARRELGDQERGDVLRFAEENYLDEIAEDLLAGGLEDEGASAFRLASLHFSRGRLAEGKAVLDRHVELAGDDAALKAELLFKVAAVLQNARLLDAARERLVEAVALEPANRDFLIRLAELQSEAGDVDGALENFETAWQLSDTDEDRGDMDQRIYSLLQLADLKTGKLADPGLNPLQLPDGAAPAGVDDLARFLRSQGLAGAATEEENAGRLIRFYRALLDAASERKTPELRLRAAWWGHRLGDYSSAYRLLSELRESNPSDLRAERLLLEVAISLKDDRLALRQLDLLSKLDEGRATEYALRRADFRLSQNAEGFREEALEDLARIANDEETDAALLKDLARVYERLGQHREALEMYKRAFERSTLHEKRSLIIELNRLHVQTGEIDAALDLMTGLIREEHDLLQRRKELADAVNLATRNQRLGKLEEDFAALQRRYPLEPFYAEALASIYENLGKSKEAFDAIKKAYYGSRTKDGHLLERMRHLAAATRDVGAAIYYQKQLVAVPDNRAEAGEWQKLIRMLELDFQVREADRIRLRLESKFAQDPEVLRELSEYYLATRQPSAARRVLGRMVRLRPWDVTSLLTLGILEREAGNVSEAANLFFEILKRTREVAGRETGEETLERFPLRCFSKGARPELTNRKRAPELLVEALDDGFILNRLRVEMTQYLESGRPEFQAVPDKPEAQRLRAIEELGELAATETESAIRGRWKEFWSENAAGSREEELWVAWCGGDEEEAWRILTESSAPFLGGPEELFYCLYGVRTNRLSQLLGWVRESVASSGARNRRLSWLFTAVYLMTLDPAKAYPDDQLELLLESELMTSQHIYKLLNLLEREGRSREALHIGELARERMRGSEGFFEYLLASLAYAVGDAGRQRAYLELALEEFDPIDPKFQEAVVALYHLQDTDDERRELRERALLRLTAVADDARAAFGRARLHALAGEDHAAKNEMRRAVSLHLDGAKTVRFSLETTLINESSLWASLFNYAYGARSLGLSAAARGPFTEALQRYDLVAPRTEAPAGQFREFQSFFHQQVLWEFEDLDFRERKALLKSNQSLFQTADDRQSLANTLARGDFHRDTIPLYANLLYGNHLENSHARALFTACENAQDSEPALAYLDLLLHNELPSPEGFSGEYFQRMHALFLWMARDLERLKVLADEQLRLAVNLAPGARHYHLYLASLLAESGRLEEAARIHAAIDDGVHRDVPILRQHAEIALGLGREEAAIDLLERVDLGKLATAAEKPVLGDLAPLYASSGEHEKLRSLAARALEFEDDALTGEIADVLVSAGKESEAESMLTLAMRRARTDTTRLPLVVQALEIAVQSEIYERVEPLLEIFFACDLSESAQELGELVALLRETAGGPMSENLRAFLEAQERAAGRHAKANVCLLEFELGAGPGRAGRSAEIVRSLTESNAASGELQVAVAACLEHGAAGLAGKLLQALRKLQPRAYENAPLAVRAHVALGEDAALSALFQELLRHDYRGNVPVKLRHEIPEAFAAAGQAVRAARLYRHYYSQIPVLGREHREFVAQYVQFLVKNGDYIEAENVLRRVFRKSLDTDPGLIVTLYANWGRLDSLTAELRKFELSSGLLKKVEFLAEQYREKKESLSEGAKRE